MQDDGTVTCQWIIYQNREYKKGEKIPEILVEQIKRKDFAEMSLKAITSTGYANIDKNQYVGCSVPRGGVVINAETEEQRETLKALFGNLF